MRRLSIPSLLAALALCASGCKANPGQGGGGPLQNPPPGPVEADFTQVGEVLQATAYGGASIWGTGLHSVAVATDPPPPGQAPVPVSNPFIDPTSGTLLVVFESGVDASDCLTAAQQAEVSGTELVISGTGTSQFATPPPCPAGQLCSAAAIAPHWEIDIQTLTSCTITPEPTPNFSTHFSAVTSATAPYVCPPNTECPQPQYCEVNDPTCAPTGSIVGAATTTYSGSDGSSQSYGPLNTTLTFTAGTCASIAEQANADGRGLTVTGNGTVETLAVDPACISAPDGTLSCGQGGVNVFIDATVIATCVEDPPAAAGAN